MIPGRLAGALGLLFLLAPTAQPAAKDADPPTAQQIQNHPEFQGAVAIVEAWIEAIRLYDDVPGLSVGLVRDQDLVWSRGFGYSNLEAERPADADTIYSICSISKLFTAIGVMQQRDAGRLNLHDPVGEHLDWYDIQQAHEGSGPATVRNLLTHSSGLPRESNFGYWSGDFPFPTREQMIAKLEEQQTLYPADLRFQYSNLALSLAGEIVQAASGKEFAEYVRENILEPLGMADTRPRYPEELRGQQLAVGYTGIDRRKRRDVVAPFFTKGITPAAGFTSTVNDLARFASWQFRVLEGQTGEVLAPNTLREMQRVHWVDPDWETTWGIGFNVRREGKSTYVGHSGGCPGYITQFILDPKKKLGAIALTNAGDGPAGRVAMGVMNVLGGAVAKSGEASGEDLPDLSAYVGDYESPPWGGERAVRQWGDGLAAVELPSSSLRRITKLKHLEGHTFVRLTDEGEEREPWIFEVDSSGKATRLVVHGNASVRIQDDG